MLKTAKLQRLGNRQLGKEAVCLLGSTNCYTTYRVEGETLYVRRPGGMSEEARDIIIQCKWDIIEYLTRPPLVAECRDGHKISWRCTEYGLWLYTCDECDLAAARKS
jgi:hypothetical protein